MNERSFHSLPLDPCLNFILFNNYNYFVIIIIIFYLFFLEKKMSCYSTAISNNKVNDVDIGYIKKFQKDKYGITCAVCSKSFEHRKSLNKHLLTHSLPENVIFSFQCDKCYKYFSKKQNMKTHRALIHGVLEES